MVAGAEQLQRLLLGAPAITVAVPGHRTPRRDGVDSHAVLLDIRNRATAALPDGPTLTIGGDCGADLAPLAEQCERRAGDLAVLWLDAHADFNTPESSPSGAFHGMVLRTLTGVGPEGFVPSVPLAPTALVLGGARALDPGEATAVDQAGVSLLGVAALAEPQRVVDALVATGRSAVYLHLDLDVLDPEVFGHVGFPEPGGATVARVQTVIEAVAGTLPVAGAFVGEYLAGPGTTTDAVAPLLHALWQAVSAG